MKRFSITLLLAIYVCVCSAQLSKFEGTWVSKDTQMFIDRDGNAHPDAERVATIRIDVSGKDVNIRYKMYARHFDTGNESTHYFSIKNIVINADSTITCDVYSPPEMGKTYVGKTTPCNRQYDWLVEHSKYRFKIVGVVLDVEIGPTIREFYYNRQLVETDCYPDENDISHCEYYNEKDNW